MSKVVERTFYEIKIFVNWYKLDKRVSDWVRVLQNSLTAFEGWMSLKMALA